MRLVGWISFTRRLLWQQRAADELAARRDVAPLGNAKKIDPATVRRPGSRDKE